MFSYLLDAAWLFATAERGEWLGGSGGADLAWKATKRNDYLHCGLKNNPDLLTSDEEDGGGTGWGAKRRGKLGEIRTLDIELLKSGEWLLAEASCNKNKRFKISIQKKNYWHQQFYCFFFTMC